MFWKAMKSYEKLWKSYKIVMKIYEKLWIVMRKLRNVMKKECKCIISYENAMKCYQ